MRTLGSYQLLRKIGSGGMAEVWSARRDAGVAGEKYVAIKILARHLAENPRYREMFVGEAKISLTLNHANIVTVFEVVEDDGECYMVMELIEGMTLSQLVRSLKKRGQTLPAQVAVYVVAELLRALAYAHGIQTEHGSTIVHRDVSPQNVMVSTSGEVKLMDFGIARFSTEETSGNLVKGKLQYMPPEQLSKRTREATIDLFAVGGVLQELLEGKRFRGGIEQEVLLGMVFKGEVPEPTVEIPTALDQVRRMLLDPDPDARLPSAKLALSMIYDWPDYRNASLELEELVCQFVEPSSATSLPSTPILDDPSAKIDVDSAPVLGQGAELPQPPIAKSEEPAQAATSSSAEDPFMTLEDGDLDEDNDRELDSEVNRVEAPSDTTDGGEHEALTMVEAPTPPAFAADEPLTQMWAQAQGKRVAVIVGGLLLLILAFAVWRSGVFDDEPEPVADAKEDVRIIAAPPVESDPAEAPASADTETGDAGTEGDEELALEDGEDEVEDEATEPDPSKKKVKPKVAVEFVAGNFYFVYVKVGGRILTLEPKTKTRLTIGNHAVYLRTKPSESWKRAGSISLRRGHSYRVEMKKPASLRLTKK